jgi:hypothetical protein
MLRIRERDLSSPGLVHRLSRKTRRTVLVDAVHDLAFPKRS